MREKGKICGFNIDRVRTSEELGGTLYEMTHEKTGASLIWLDNKEENKLFSIAFKTLPADDTGVFHIIEHSVLNGSRRYTVKDPFLELLKSSMNTFLNAMTSSDNTVYPVSSKNDKDFFNLVSVYLDAVFFPAMYENPNIFYQEGWHYELFDEEETPTYKGVVYNEMKGVFASPDSILKNGLYKMMFPDNCYQYEPGGDPKAIPELTYEQFLKCHKENYHPGNSRIYLDGDIQLESILTLIDQYLSQFERTEINRDIPAQKPVTGLSAQDTYQGSPEEGALISFGKVMCSYADTIKRFAMSVLASYLTETNDSPVKRVLLENGIAQDIYMYIDDGCQDVPFMTVAKQLDMEKTDELWQVLESVRSEILEEGIPKEELHAILNQMEFSIREIDEPKGLGRNMAALNTWLHGGDPMEMLVFDDTFARLRELVETDYYEKLLEELPLSKADSVVYMLTPSESKDQENFDEEVCKLADAKASWTTEETQSIIKLNQYLATWQMTDNSPEDLATLPVLFLDEVSPEPELMQTEMIDGVLFHHTQEKGISHVNMYFSLTGLDPKDYGAASFLTNMLGELPTKSTNLSDLMRKIKSTIGFIDYNVSVYGKQGDMENCHPYFIVNFSVLSQNLQEAVALVCEILNETDFDSEYTPLLVEDILYQCQYAMQENIIEGGDQFARGMALSQVNACALADDMLNGYRLHLWLKDFDENLEEAYGRFVAVMKKMQQEVFTSANMKISLAAEEFQEPVTKAFELMHKDGETAGAEFVQLAPEKATKSQVLEIPGGVAYAGLAANTYDFGVEPSGKMQALSKLMSFQYLWNEIRVIGGAYGCGLDMALNGNIVFKSYRDPDPVNSQKVFAKAGDFVREYVNGQDNFEKILISAAASLEPLLDVRKAQEYADYEWFVGITAEDKKKFKKELLEMKKEDLLEYCDLLDRIGEEGYSCTVGPKVLLDQLQAEVVHTL